MTWLLIHKARGPTLGPVPMACPREGEDRDVGSPLQAGQVGRVIPTGSMVLITLSKRKYSCKGHGGDG